MSVQPLVDKSPGYYRSSEGKVQGWFKFRRRLEYKLAGNGSRLIVVPQNTRRTCPACGHGSADNRQTQVRFKCVDYGFEEHANVVGAITVLARGMQILRDEGQDALHRDGARLCQPGWPVD